MKGLEKYLKIAVISLISFGWFHFLSDKLWLKIGIPTYLKVKNIFGKITIVLTVVILILLIFILIF